MQIFLTILAVLCAIVLIASVLMQSSRSAGASGVVGGASENFFGKKKGLDALFSKVTIATAVLLAIISLVLGMM